VLIKKIRVQTTNTKIKTGTGRKSTYFFKDHKGNVRASIDESGQIISAQDYFPFAKVMRSYTLAGNGKQRYKYSGKELDASTNYSYYGFRYYNADIARWMNPDPAHQFASPYVFNGNIPHIGIDVDGRIFILDDLLITMAIYATVNTAADAIRGDINSFEDGLVSFGKGALKGAIAYALAGGTDVVNLPTNLTGGMYQHSFFDAGNVFADAVSSQLPGINIPISENASISIGPSFFKGSNGWGVGATADFNFRDRNLQLGFGLSGHYNSSMQGTGKSGFSYRTGIRASLGDDDFRLNYSNSYFSENGGQRTGRFGFSSGNWAVDIENDAAWTFGDKLDRYRTSMNNITYTDPKTGNKFGLGLRLFTGEQGARRQFGKTNNSRTNGQEYYDNLGGYYDTDKYREGILYFNFIRNGRSYQFGYNSENIRNRTQNLWIHNLFGAPHFLTFPNQFPDRYFYNISTHNPYTYW
jgi:RHS repeat-associated protein